MAAAAPDLSGLTSSAQVFSQQQQPARTLPQIRALHGHLQAEAADRAARLRTRVGASYRDLLGTADAIVAMRADAAGVQDALARMGARCGRGVVSAKAAALGRFADGDGDAAGAGGGALGARARAGVLRGCVLAAESALRAAGAERAGESLVAAAKALVLGRLLVKSFGGQAAADGAVVAAVEAADRRLAKLRNRLRWRVDRTLQAAGERVDREAVLRALSAYSLATGSGAKDALRHFLLVRSAAMVSVLSAEDDEAPRGAEGVLECLGLYAKTLLDVQALVPTKLAGALGSLKKSALLADESLRAIEALRLDVYERWCGDEIQYFTPFIRHDDLDGRQAREMLFAWAEDKGGVFRQGLDQALASMSDLKAIVEIRTTVLRMWISDGGKARGFDPSVLLNQVREAVNKHLLRVLDTKVSKLHLVGSEVSATLEAWQEGTTDKHAGMWDEGSFDMDMHSGAAHFTQEVVSKLYGRNDAVSKAVLSYRSWYQVIDDVGQVVDQLRRQRWDNDVEEIEDEETIEHRQQLLSKDDPQTLHAHLDSSLVKAFRSLDEQLAALWSSCRESPNKGEVAMYLARLLRDVRGQLPDLVGVNDFGLGTVPALHEAIATAVAVSPLDEFATRALTRKFVAGRSLWEGEPRLPTSPSPGAFRFLRDLSMAMSDAGMDLWSPSAVQALKRHLREQLAELWLEVMPKGTAERQGEEDEETSVSHGGRGGKDEKKTDGEEEGEEGEDGEGEEEAREGEREGADPRPEHQTDLLIQWLFDVSYLRSCLSQPSCTADDELRELEGAIYERSGIESGEMRRRLERASRDYWKKTNLLFGLLS